MNSRLQKLMSHAGLGSRRRCEAIIRAGRVAVNGRQASLGDRADPERDRITVDGRPLALDKNTFVYVMVNKPKGVISSLEDELGQSRRTVRDLVDMPGHLYPVGRLDKPSEGLMLLTNDGDLAHKLTHPRYGHAKVYLATLSGRITPAALRQWRQGVSLDGRETAPADVELVGQDSTSSTLRVELREGRKRQIRRVAAQLGYPVIHLRRVSLGTLQLGSLPPGEWRHLTTEELRRLRQSI